MTKPRAPQTDLLVALPQPFGTVGTIRPVTPTGRRWLKQHVADHAYNWFGDALVVETRFLGEILTGAQVDGLTLAAPAGGCGDGQ